MTPGLALFYGGMVRAKSVLNMMMMSFGALASISVIWVLYGYSPPSGTTLATACSAIPRSTWASRASWRTPEQACPDGLRGLPGRVRDHHRGPDLRGDRRPRQVLTWLIFAGIWATLVYFPIAHWVFDFSLDASTSAAGSPTTWLRSTSQVAPPFTSTPVSPALRSPSSLASGSAGSAIRCGRTT